MVSPLKMKNSCGPTPKGVPGISMGMDGKKGSTPTKVMKGVRTAGAMYKTPSFGSLKGRNAKDQSSGQSLPTRQSKSDKVQYTAAKQPVAFSNESGPRATKFVS